MSTHNETAELLRAAVSGDFSLRELAGAPPEAWRTEALSRAWTISSDPTRRSRLLALRALSPAERSKLQQLEAWAAQDMRPEDRGPSGPGWNNFGRKWLPQPGWSGLLSGTEDAWTTLRSARDLSRPLEDALRSLATWYPLTVEMITPERLSPEDVARQAGNDELAALSFALGLSWTPEAVILRGHAEPEAETPAWDAEGRALEAGDGHNPARNYVIADYPRGQLRDTLSNLLRDLSSRALGPTLTPLGLPPRLHRRLPGKETILAAAWAQHQAPLDRDWLRDTPVGPPGSRVGVPALGLSLIAARGGQ